MERFEPSLPGNIPVEELPDSHPMLLFRQDLRIGAVAS